MIAANRLLCNTRYVDNRAMMGFGSWRCSPIWSVFTHAEFYGAPILLEEVSDPILLGYTSTQIKEPLQFVSIMI